MYISKIKVMSPSGAERNKLNNSIAASVILSIVRRQVGAMSSA